MVEKLASSLDVSDNDYAIISEGRIDVIEQLNLEGYSVERFWGQTHIIIPGANRKNLPESEVRLSTHLFFYGKMDRGEHKDHANYCRDALFLSLPSVRVAKNHLGGERIAKLERMFEINPCLVFPDWYIPDYLAKDLLNIMRKNMGL